MKKILPIVLFIAFVFAVSCGQNKNNGEKIRDGHADSIMRKEWQEKETERLKKLKENETGIWGIEYYKDQFGEQTRKAYMTNISPIRGVFSNTATENSPLGVKLIVESYNKIALILYEYNDSNPVKDYDQQYIVYLKNNKDEKMGVIALNSSDRLNFYEKDCLDIMKMFFKSSWVKFAIINRSRTSSTYNFGFELEGFQNVYKKVGSNYYLLKE